MLISLDRKIEVLERPPVVVLVVALVQAGYGIQRIPASLGGSRSSDKPDPDLPRSARGLRSLSRSQASAQVLMQQ